MFRLDGKTVAVIGAGSGIGQAVALGCAEQGAYVCCFDIDASMAEVTADTIRGAGGEAESGRVDITSVPTVHDGLAHAAGKHKRLDGVVCTPAINVRKAILNYKPEEFERVVKVNLQGSFNVLQAAGAFMVAQGFGSIVLFSSIARSRRSGRRCIR